MKDSGAQGEGEVGQARGDADHDAAAGFADRGQAVGESGHTGQSETGTESKPSSVGRTDHGSQV